MWASNSFFLYWSFKDSVGLQSFWLQLVSSVGNSSQTPHWTKILSLKLIVLLVSSLCALPTSFALNLMAVTLVLKQWAWGEGNLLIQFGQKAFPFGWQDPTYLYTVFFLNIQDNFTLFQSFVKSEFV